MKKILIIFLLLLPASASALLRRSAVPLFTATAQLNIGTQQDLLSGAFMNIMKTAQLSFCQSDTPVITDINGYPITTIACTNNYGASVVYPSSLYTNSTVFVLKWPATRPITLTLNGGQTITNCFTVPTCTTGSSSQTTVAGTGSQCTTVDPYWGNGCRVEFTATSIGSMFFPAGAQNYAAGSGDLVLIRKSDEASYDAYEAAGKVAGAFTPEFLAQIGGLHPETIRVMGWNNTNASNETSWSCRTTTLTLSYYSASVYCPALWGGTISGTDTYTIGNSPTPISSWADGTLIQGTLTNAPTQITISAVANNGSGLCRLTVNSTSTLSTNQVVFIGGTNTVTCGSVPPAYSTITVIDSTHVDVQGSTYAAGGLNGGGAVIGTQTLTISGVSGAKFIGNLTGGPWGTNFQGYPSAGCCLTFRYDAVLNMVIQSNGGIQYTVPVESAVALANAVGANLWDTYPAMALDSYNTSRATTVLGLLNSNLNYYVEYSNENWNSFLQRYWEFARGAALGWPSSSDAQLFSWQSYASIKLFRDVATAWSNSPRVKNVLAVQYCCYGSSYDQLLSQSADLNGATYPLYCAFVGGTYSGVGPTCTGDPEYYQSPNRAIDIAGKYSPGILSGAPYWQGASFTGGSYNSPSTYSINYLQTMLTDFASGGSGITTAEAMLDADIRAGACNAQAVTFAGVTATISSGNLNCPNQNGNLNNGNIITFTTTGTLPTGIVAGYPYFVVNNNSGAGTFQISATSGGSAITPSGGSGTLTAGRVDGTGNLLELVADYYGSNNSTLNGMQNYVTAGGYNVTIQAYEGGYQMVAPTSTQCTAMGVTATPSGGGSPTAAGCAYQAGALLSAYLYSLYGSAMVQSQFNQFRGLDATQVNFGLVPADTVPSMLADQNLVPWNLCPGQLGALMCYSTYSGFATYH